MLTYFTAATDLPCGIKLGDTISLNTENPAEPVMVHRPVSGACAAKVAAWLEAGVLVPAIPSGGASEVPSSPSPARPRLRLLPRDDQRTA